MRNDEDLTPEDLIKEAEELEREIAEEEYEERRGHTVKILAVTLGLLVVLMVIPFYSIKLDPEPDMNAVTRIISQINSDNTRAALRKINISISRGPQYNNIAYLASGVSSTTKQIADVVVSAACRRSAGGRENRVCHAKAIYYFVRDAMQYVGDPPDEYYKSPEESLLTLTGDCDDHSILLSSLLRAVGIRTRLVRIPNHVYVEAYIPEASGKYKTDDGWIRLDATCKNCEFGQISSSTARAEGTSKRYIYI